MENKKRTLIQKEFTRNIIRVLVCTSAFGMGLNKPDIRLIIHFDIPSSFENYIQEIGRAGRDLKPAEAILLINDNVNILINRFRSILIVISLTSTQHPLISNQLPF